MPRYFISPEDIQGSYIIVRKDVHHLIDVLRKSPGDRLLLCDGLGHDFSCEIIQVDEQKEKIVTKVLERRDSDTEPSVFVTLIQALPKGDRMEYVLEKGVEVGISSFVPFDTERSMVHLDSHRAQSKVERWNKLTESAAKQCGRGRIPKVEPLHSFEEAVSLIPSYDLSLLFYEEAPHQSLKDTLQRLPARPEKVCLFIGSEGGFSPKEAERIQEAGAVVCGLGPRILRADTAGVVAASLLLYEFRQME